ncbi:Cu(I)-responsive transcriptional regulator [Kingella oralis]|jgi:Cu(I)-responsive transcriptional regulator|uniref:Cu(I)-responsive transcriptional regulator n=1 Tax=Kingella oralis TaxID=505 RepID=UPI0034E500A1
MNISQAAAQTGLSAKQIRDYEKQGLLPPAPRSEAGYRRFLPADLQRLRFIAHAREVGFSLAQIKRLLALADDPQRHSRDVKQLASEHIAELNQKIATLQTMRDTLQAWHNQCAGDDAAVCCILEGIGSLKMEEAG